MNAQYVIVILADALTGNRTIVDITTNQISGTVEYQRHKLNAILNPYHKRNPMPTEATIILAIIGMVGLFTTATVYQRANRLSSRYYNQK